MVRPDRQRDEGGQDDFPTDASGGHRVSAAWSTRHCQDSESTLPGALKLVVNGGSDQGRTPPCLVRRLGGSFRLRLDGAPE